MTITGADLIIEWLEHHGVRIVPGIPGGALLPLYEALGRSKVLRHILARHEQAAGLIAHGMARVTGKAAVCLATSGPGVTNLVTAIADAKLDSVPLVCITGQVPTYMMGTDAFQEVPTVDIVRPITKAAFLVRSADELIHLLPEAFRIAESGRPGPVLIDVPKNVQLQRVERPTRWDAAAPVPTDRIDSRLIEQIVKELEAAERPVLYVGGGVVKTRAMSLVQAVAERGSIPVTTTLMALGALPSEHPLNLGMLGMHGARFTNQVIEESDLLIAIGARFDDRATGKPDAFAPKARIIHVDVDARELGKIKKPALAIHGDARQLLAQLIEVMPRRTRPQWLARVATLRESLPLKQPGAEAVCSPYGIIRALGRIVPKDAIITTDVGQHQMWAAQAYPFTRADRWLTSGGLGTMGFGLPAAIGAALVEPETPVVCISGDGSLLMNVQELATLAELNLNVKLILLDNQALGMVRQQQELFYQQRFVASLFERCSDFVAIARAFGIPASDLGRTSDPAGELRQAFAQPGPTLIRVPIAAQSHVMPMVAPGAANSQALDHPESELELAESAVDALDAYCGKPSRIRVSYS